MPSNEHETAQFTPPELFGSHTQEQQIDQYIQSGVLPWDTYLRVRTVGVCEADWADSQRRLAFSIAQDLAKNGTDPDAMRVDTQRLLFGPTPNAVVDYEHSWANKEAYLRCDPMYYRLPNLARVIKRQRTEAGQTITKFPPNAWYSSVEYYENARCLSLARPIWRTIVQRIHPEWLSRPSDFSMSYSIGVHGGTYELSEQTQRRSIIGAAVIRDDIMLEIYDEATRTGVRGIGPKGRDALRELLSDEHPELY